MATRVLFVAIVAQPKAATFRLLLQRETFHRFGLHLGGGCARWWWCRERGALRRCWKQAAGR